MIAIGLVNYFGNDELTPEQQVVRAAVAQNDALQKENYADFRTNTCRSEQGTETEVIAGQRDSKEKQGRRLIDDVTDVVVNGDHATARVTYQFDKTPDTKTGCRNDVRARGRGMEGLYTGLQLAVGHSRP